jgi:hypothetical protein
MADEFYTAIPKVKEFAYIIRKSILIDNKQMLAKPEEKQEVEKEIHELHTYLNTLDNFTLKFVLLFTHIGMETKGKKEIFTKELNTEICKSIDFEDASYFNEIRTKIALNEPLKEEEIRFAKIDKNYVINKIVSYRENLYLYLRDGINVTGVSF